MSIYYDLGAHPLFFSPVVITLGHRNFSNNALASLFFLLQNTRVILIDIFVRAALTTHYLICFVWAIANIVGILALCCGVKTFKNEVSKFTLHEAHVNIFENAGWFGLNYTNVVNASWWDSDNLFVHQRFHQLGNLLSFVDAIVIWAVKRRWWHEWCGNLDLILIVSSTGTIAGWWLSRATTFKSREKITTSVKRICDSREANFFIGASSSFLDVVCKLAKLATSICAEAVKMAWISECFGVSLATGNRNDLFVG